MLTFSFIRYLLFYNSYLFYYIDLLKHKALKNILAKYDK